MMISLSIVVIIYKIEEYLSQCIDSILCQSYKDFELILVDDGSPDACPDICDEYAIKDKRVKVLHQENQGAIVARRNGILAAEGEYIALLDGDDWVEFDMYNHMVSLAEKNQADIVIVGYNEDMQLNSVKKKNALESGIYKDKKLELIYKNAIYTGKFYEPGIVPALWNKIFKRSLFINDCIFVDPVVRMGEDASVSYPMLVRAKTIVIDNSFYPYHYRIVQGSMSRNYDEMYFDRTIKLLSGLQTNLATNDDMLDSLQYYSLFVTQIGIEQLFSRACNLSFRKKKDKLRRYMQQFDGLNLLSNIDWSGFNWYTRNFMNCFINEKANRLVLTIYANKIIARICKRINILW